MGLFESVSEGKISGLIRKGESFDSLKNMTKFAEDMGIEPEDSHYEAWNQYIENISSDLMGYISKNKFKFDDINYYKLITERANEIHIIAKEIMDLSEHNVEKILNSKNQNDKIKVYDKMGKAIEILEHFRSDLTGESAVSKNHNMEMNDTEIRKTLEDTAITLMKLDLDIRGTIENIKPGSNFTNN